VLWNVFESLTAKSMTLASELVDTRRQPFDRREVKMKARDQRFVLSTVALMILAWTGELVGQTTISGEGIIFPDGSVQTTAPGVEFLRAAGAVFVPRRSDTSFSYGGAGCLQRDGTTGESYFLHGLTLPDRALVDYLRVYYYDDDVSSDIRAALYTYDGYGNYRLIAEAVSSASPGYSSTGSGFFAHTVDNMTESLAVLADFGGGSGSDLQFCGIRIRYQAPGTFTPEALEKADTPPPDPCAPDSAEQDSCFEGYPPYLQIFERERLE
jgi:hypothetical protein